MKSGRLAVLAIAAWLVLAGVGRAWAQSKGSAPAEPKGSGSEQSKATPQSDKTAKSWPAQETAKPAPLPRPADTNAAEPVHVNEFLEANNLIYKKEPEYPPLAKVTHVQGTVKFKAVIGKDGTVESLKLISGHPLLVKAAMDAAKEWRYRPPVMKGEPVEIETEIEVDFSLPSGQIYGVGLGVTAPRPYDTREPPYTTEARLAKVHGTVVLSIVVGADGLVSDVRVTRPLDKGLDEQAVETVKTWKFHPALRNGKPVAVRVIVEVSFRLFK